jgi:hypothetical protein
MRKRKVKKFQSSYSTINLNTAELFPDCDKDILPVVRVSETIKSIRHGGLVF